MLRSAFVFLAMVGFSLHAGACGCMRTPLDYHVNSATEILRVKVSAKANEEARTRDGLKAAVYRVEVLEFLFPNVSDRKKMNVRSATTSCELYLLPGEEWLLFLHDGEISQCHGDALLGNVHPARRHPSIDPTEFEQAQTQAQAQAAEQLRLVRSLARERASRSPAGR